MKEKVITIIPAKEYSRRLAGKNLLTIGGSTMLDLAVKRAMFSGLGEVRVSTESKKIKEHISNQGYSFKDNFRVLNRPEFLADSSTRLPEVIMEAINVNQYDTLIVTLCSSPLCTLPPRQPILTKIRKNHLFPTGGVPSPWGRELPWKVQSVKCKG